MCKIYYHILQDKNVWLFLYFPKSFKLLNPTQNIVITKYELFDIDQTKVV